MVQVVNRMVIPKLATGRNKYSFHLQAFTLIEMLVVLIVIAIVGTMATMSMNAYFRGREMQAIAQELKVVIAAARHQAILLPETLGLVIQPHQYAFYRFIPAQTENSGSWQPFTTQKLLKEKTISSTLILTVQSQAATEKTEKSVTPQIIFFRDGTLTPFQITIQKAKEPRGYQISGSGNGTLTIQSIP